MPAGFNMCQQGSSRGVAQQPGIGSSLCNCAAQGGLTHSSPHHVVLPQQGVRVDAGRIQHCQHTFLLRQLLQPPEGTGARLWGT